MPTKTKRLPLNITDEERQKLTKIAQSRSAPYWKVRRAQILEQYADGSNFTEIAAALRTTRRIVYQCVDRALQMGIARALEDMPHARRPTKILPEDEAWVMQIACRKPKDFGYTAELWTRQSLAKHIREHCVDEGHPALSKAVKATVQRIINRQNKARYYLECREPGFETRVKGVLLIYRNIATAHVEGLKTTNGKPTNIVTDDKKPGVLSAHGLSPVPGEHATHENDYEYRPLRTTSILAALDLHNGHITAKVVQRHGACEFIKLLQDMDTHYPEDVMIRIIINNRSANISRGMQKYIADKPDRFSYVHTLKHGSRLNLIETLFSKTIYAFLRHIRVESCDELEERIFKWIDEINAAQVIHK